jgi:phosphoribosylaminoimidazole-succinocarboxamide synthase
VSREEYELLELYSLALFKRGQRIAANAGLILVDTKYEFGRDPDTGNIVLIDEVHTPDSSRFWAAATYIERMQEGLHPEMYDKEFARLWFSDQGYRGDGEPPQMPSEVVAAVRERYIFAYEGLLGKPFTPEFNNPQTRVVSNIQKWYSTIHA